MTLFAALVTAAAYIFAFMGVLFLIGALRWYQTARKLPNGKGRNDAFGNLVGSLLCAASCFMFGSWILHLGGLS